MGREMSNSHRQKLRRGLWSPEEDEKLYNHIIRYGVGCWSSVPKLAGLERCGKSCRLRWINYLRPDLKRGSFSMQEEELIISLHKHLGNRWSQIASQLPGRTDNEIKNFWNSCLKKKLRQRGIDPSTHQPMNETPVAQEEKLDTNSFSIGGPLETPPMFGPLTETRQDGINPIQSSMSDPYNQSFHSFRSLKQDDMLRSSNFCEHNKGLDVSDNAYGYGESSSNSGNWNGNVSREMSNVLGNEVLSWGTEEKMEPLNNIVMFGEEPSPFQPKFSPWQDSRSYPIRSLSRGLPETCFDISRDEFNVDFL